MVIVTLHPWCSEDLFPIARELIALDWKGRSFEGVAAGFLRAILCPSHVGNDGVADSGGSAGSPLDDSDLVALLELVVDHSSSELLGTVFELLRERLPDAGLTLTIPPSKDALLSASTLVTSSLLNSGSSLPSRCSVPFEYCGSFPTTDSLDHLPSQSQDTLAATLACLESPKVSNCILEVPPPLLVSEDTVLGLLELSIDAATLPCAELVSLLIRAAPRITECFATSHLHDVCSRAGEGNEGALGVVRDFLAHAVGRKDVNVVRRALLDKCLGIVESGLMWSLDEKSRAGAVLQELAKRSPKALKRLVKKCTEWLSGSATAIQLYLASVVAVESKDEELCSLFVAKCLPVLSGNIQSKEFVHSGEEADLTVGLSILLRSNSSSLGDLPSFLGAEDWNKFLFCYLKYKFDWCGHQLLALLLPVVYRHANEGYTSLDVVYGMIWSHSKFIPILSSRDLAMKKEKECLVELLISVVELSLAVCKTSHVLGFLGAYSASQSKSDRGLLYLISKYEGNKLPAGEFSPFLWGEAALEQYRLRQGMYTSPLDISDVLKLLDTPTLLKSASAFSPYRKLEPSNPYLESQHWFLDREEDEKLYDPCFMLPLLSHYLETGAHMDCRLFIGHGCLAFLFVALSSMHKEVRVAAGHALTRFKVHLEESKFREKPQIALLLEVLRNSIAEHVPRLQSVWTAFAAKTSLLFLHANNAAYSVVSRFTVHKPAFYLREIPLLFTMLHSSSVTGSEEQLWLLKVLVDGLRCKDDCRLYEKHKVFSHVAALAGSSILDQRTKELAKLLLKRAIKVNQE